MRSLRQPAWTSISATLARPGSAAPTRSINGLLRQYLPKGSDLSFYGPGMFDNIAAELNSRPRKRHGFRTPAEMLDAILIKAADYHGGGCPEVRGTSVAVR